MAINYLLEEALVTTKGRYWYIAPTYSQAKMIAWRMLSDQLMKLPPELIKKKNESELYVEIGNGSLIELKGADKEDSLRGVGLHGVVLDEYATIKPNVFDEIIRPALADHEGWAMFIGTPKGYNHFWNIYKLGSKDHEEYKSFHYTSYDNPYVPNIEIEKAKSDMGEDLFAQEYMAEFTRFEGMVYKEWNRAHHLMPEWKPNPGSEVYRAMDFGATNPTACLWIHVNADGEVIVFDEYYQREQTIDFHSGVILSKHTEFDYRLTYGDPSGKQEMLDYATRGLYITPAVKTQPGEHGWVVSGINEIKALLKVNPSNGRPKLFITENCENLIREIENYRWMEQSKNANAPRRDMPVKVEDHGADALRMFVVSYRPSQASRRRRGRGKQIVRQRSSITGY
tara:strand:+ start:49 stop:1239 length:1191 start_codon:yes stop_codon:yes gene_type:complete